MVFNAEAVIYYLFVIDAIMANIFALFYPNWLKKNYKGFYKHFPLTKGWALFYLILVIWIGCALYRLGILF